MTGTLQAPAGPHGPGLALHSLGLGAGPDPWQMRCELQGRWAEDAQLAPGAPVSDLSLICLSFSTCPYKYQCQNVVQSQAHCTHRPKGHKIFAALLQGCWRRGSSCGWGCGWRGTRGRFTAPLRVRTRMAACGQCWRPLRSSPRACWSEGERAAGGLGTWASRLQACSQLGAPGSFSGWSAAAQTLFAICSAQKPAGGGAAGSLRTWPRASSLGHVWQCVGCVAVQHLCPHSILVQLLSSQHLGSSPACQGGTHTAFFSCGTTLPHLLCQQRMWAGGTFLSVPRPQERLGGQVRQP